MPKPDSPNPAIWYVGRADAAPETVPAAASVDLSAQDTNDVEITNPPGTPITITSFGEAVPWMRVKVEFIDNGITLQNSATVVLIGGANKLFRAGDISQFRGQADGSWKEEIIIIPNGGLLRIDNFTASQVVTIPGGAKSAKVEMAGGGGFAQADGSNNTPTAGGTGAYLEKSLDGLVSGNTLNLTVGLGGTTTTAKDGGDTVLTSGTQAIPNTLTAGGGKGGVGTAPNAGGVATGGDVNQQGGSGTGSMVSIGTGAGNVVPQAIAEGNLWVSTNRAFGFGAANPGQTPGGGGAATWSGATNLSAAGARGAARITWFT